MMSATSFPTSQALITVLDHHHEGPRKRMLDFLSTISKDDFIRQVPEIGGKSLRDVLLHIVGANEFWISLLKGRPHMRFKGDDYETVESIIPIFDETNDKIRDFLGEVDERWLAAEMTVSLGAESMRLVPAMAAVHMLTHEYHHKGQIVAISRILGYEPPDTDLL